MTPAFELIILGCTGGPREDNLSGYLISPIKQQEWIALDAGTLLKGIEMAMQQGHLSKVAFHHPDLHPAAEMLTHHVKGYLLSHAHLDHVSGLVINSQMDQEKWIAGIEPTIDNLKNHLFNNKIWPNYGNEGEPPIIKRYHYLRLPLQKTLPLPNTSFSVESFLLSHPHNYPSSAFLLTHDSQHLLYLGDTAADAQEEKKHLSRIWQRVGPLIQKQTLHGILLECSYPHKECNRTIYGHLDTQSMIEELHNLTDVAKCSLQGLKVIVTHRKESFKQEKDNLDLIEEELRSLNDLGIEFIFPSQGNSYIL